MSKSLDIWLVKDAEPLPLAADDPRMRTGRLAESLLRRGHRITWWASTFLHFQKRHLHRGDTVIEQDVGLEFRLVEAGAYDNNLSPARWLHHRRLARRFLAQAADRPRPDAIVASLPIPGLAAAAAHVGAKTSVPVLVDVRDQWPTTFVHKAPRALRSLAWLGTRPMANQVRGLFRQADGLVAVSDGYLRWALDLADRPAGDLDRSLPLGFRLPDDAHATPSPSLATFLDKVGHRTLVVFVGSFGLSYDLTTVCRAARRLWADGVRDVEFILAGDGDQMPDLRRHADAVGNIHLPGWLNSSDMHVLLGRASLGLVCCISVPDTLPNKIYQYLAYGLPMLSSLEGEAEHLIDELGVGESYNCGDDETLALLIRRWSGNPVRRQECAESARRAHRERFDAHRIDSDYADIVERMAESARSD